MPRPANLSPELLQTFVAVHDCEGDAARAAEELGINQPSMSKRLAVLQHAGRILKRPWLQREGKQWRLTEEGRRVLPAVQELLRRYEQLTADVESAAVAGIAFACGQEALTSFVLEAVSRFQREQPHTKVFLATPRGSRRIEGVANGLFDLALVTHDADQIRARARRPLVVEELFDDPLVLACAKNAPWAVAFAHLPESGAPGRALAGWPLVLLERDAGIRQQLESRLRGEGLLRRLDVVVEAAGWTAVLACVEAGLGVGLLPRSSAGRGPALLLRRLHPSLTPPNRLRLIGRTQVGSDELDLSEAAQRFRDVLRSAAMTFHESIVESSKKR
jgi:DNA-binding transcriptional LysR family regulator